MNVLDNFIFSLRMARIYFLFFLSTMLHLQPHLERATKVENNNRLAHLNSKACILTMKTKIPVYEK